MKTETITEGTFKEKKKKNIKENKKTETFRSVLRDSQTVTV